MTSTAVDPTTGAAGAAGAVASLRERKNRATRTALRRSAVALVARRGLGAVTVEDIAADAGVSSRTFYNYFPSKEDAVTGWDPAIVADMVERLRSRPPAEKAPTALRATVYEVFALFDHDHRDLLARLRVTRSDPHLLAHHLTRWAEAERELVAVLAERRGSDPAHDRYAALVVATTLTAGRIATMSWCDRGGRVPLAEELAFHFQVLGALREPETNGSSR